MSLRRCARNNIGAINLLIKNPLEEKRNLSKSYLHKWLNSYEDSESEENSRLDHENVDNIRHKDNLDLKIKMTVIFFIMRKKNYNYYYKE